MLRLGPGQAPVEVPGGTLFLRLPTTMLVWLVHGMRLVGRRWRGVAREGSALLEVGYRQLLGYVRQWPDRVWAVEGANGAGPPLAARLLAAGEAVWDVPAKLAARIRVFDVGHGRKTDATDAHSIAIAALRTRGLRQLAHDEDLAVLRLLADRRDELSRTRAQTLNRLHRLLADLVPGGALRHLSALQVTATGSGLLGVFGTGPAGAARILADVGDITRFTDRNRVRVPDMSLTGAAPIDERG